MDSFNDSAQSAYFPGLVDICRNDDGQLVYAIVKNGELIFAPEHSSETETFTIPAQKHFKFTIPRAAEVLRYFNQEDNNLYDDLLHYLKRFSALDHEQWAIVAHYVLLTYLHDHPNIDYCAYLLFYAVPERGKSRTGKSVTYVAFRGIHLVELRQATLFRFSERMHGTMFLDLLDVSKKAEKSDCSDILLLRAEKGVPCCRVSHPELGAFDDTEYFDIYGPTIIASNEQLHKILETRCLPIIMPNRPGDYENPRPEFGLEQKERLTAFRAKHLTATFPDIAIIDGIAGRLWDITKPLFYINSLLPIDANILKESILAIAGEKDETRKDTLEGRLVAIIKEITDEGGLDRFAEWSIKTADIRSKFNQGRPADRLVSPQWIGTRLKSMSFHNRIVHGYSEIKITAPEYALILKQYGHNTGELPTLNSSLPEKVEEARTVLKEVESSRESATIAGEKFTFSSPEEKELYLERLAILLHEEKLPQKKAEEIALKSLLEWREANAIPF